LTNFCLTCSLNLQLLCRMTSSKDKLLHCGILQNLLILRVIAILPNNELLAFARVQIILSSLDQFKNSYTKRSDESELLLNGAMIVDASLYLKRAVTSL